MCIQARIEELQNELEELTGREAHIRIDFFDIPSQKEALDVSRKINQVTGRRNEWWSRNGVYGIHLEPKNIIGKRVDYSIFYEKEGYHAGKSDAPTTPVGTRTG